MTHHKPRVALRAVCHVTVSHLLGAAVSQNRRKVFAPSFLRRLPLRRLSTFSWPRFLSQGRLLLRVSSLLPVPPSPSFAPTLAACWDCGFVVVFFWSLHIPIVFLGASPSLFPSAQPTSDRPLEHDVTRYCHRQHYTAIGVRKFADSKVEVPTTVLRPLQRGITGALCTVRNVVERPAVEDPRKKLPGEFAALAKNPNDLASTSVRQERMTGELTVSCNRTPPRLLRSTSRPQQREVRTASRPDSTRPFSPTGLCFSCTHGK